MDEIVVDLEELKNHEDILSESFLASFGDLVKMVLRRMFGRSNSKVKIKGNPRDVKKFADTISNEKEYMESFMKNGLDDPKTYRSKAKLEKSVRRFESSTGLKWPFK